MFKASLAIHKSPKGKLTVLACSEDADDALNAFNECKDEGSVQLIIRNQYQRQKPIEAVPAKAAKKKAAK